MARLADKTAIITGGSGGIGRAAGALFAKEGANVLLVDIDEDALKSAVKEAGSDAVSYALADVSDEAQTQAFTALATERYGGIDIALLNAGIAGKSAPITKMAVEDFDHVMAVNTRGVFLGMKHTMPIMAERGAGSIVITSSVAGLIGTPKISAYTASKHAVVGLMRSGALEGARNKIRVNTINPAPVATQLARDLEEGFNPDDPDRAQESMLRAIPLRRYAEPPEIADLLLFLASDESRYCTGGVYTIDGGLTTY